MMPHVSPPRVSDLPPIATPFLEQISTKDAPARTASQTPLIELDQPPSVEQAIRYLKYEAPVAVEGAGGDETTFRVAAKVKDFGISEEKCFELMTEHWNERKAEPNWDPDQLRTKVRNAYAYATQNAPGSRSVAADFSPVELPEPTSNDARRAQRPKLFAVDYKDAVQESLSAAAEPLVQGFLDCGAMSVVYGESNSGKTFVALDIALHIAAGRSWNGRKTKRGFVAYIAAEGGRGIYKRLDAWRRHHGVDPTNVCMVLIPCPVDLRSLQGDTAPLIKLIEREQKSRGEPPVLVVIDTLSRAMAGGDENSSIDMGAVVKNCDRIREAIGGHCLLVHHSGKHKFAGARGHSLLRAAVDTEIEIDKRTIISKKQRDLEPAQPVKFGLKRLVLGVNAGGDSVSSCIVEMRSTSDFDPLRLSPQLDAMLEAVRRAAKAGASARGAPDEWQTTAAPGGDCDKHYREINSEREGAAIAADCRGFTERNCRQLRQTLAERGFLKKTTQGQWLLV